MGKARHFKATVRESGDNLDTVVAVVEFNDNAGFVLDSLAATVEAVGKHYGITPQEVVRDLYSIVSGKVTK